MSKAKAKAEATRDAFTIDLDGPLVVSDNTPPRHRLRLEDVGEVLGRLNPRQGD